MNHGVVVCPQMVAEGNNISLDCSLDAKELRRHLLYWDKMVYAYANELGKPNFDSLHDLRYLHDIGILSLEDVKVATKDIGKPEVTNPIEMKLATALFEMGKPTSDNPSGVTILGTPASIWPELNHFAQIKAASQLQTKGNATWTIAQASNSLELPFGDQSKATLLEANLYAGLPVPDEDTPLDEILEFKEKRKAELLKFRHAIDVLYSKMLNSPDQARELRKASEEIELAIIDLNKSLKDRNIKTFFTSLNLYLNVKDSKIFSTLLSIYGASSLGFPLEIGETIGLGINTILTFATRCIDKPVSVPKELKDFMYLYEVQKYWPNK